MIRPAKASLNRNLNAITRLVANSHACLADIPDQTEAAEDILKIQLLAIVDSATDAIQDLRNIKQYRAAVPQQGDQP